MAAALQTGYPRGPHQRCWGHKRRNLLVSVRRGDRAVVKGKRQAIYRVASRREAEAAARRVQRRWHAMYPQLVRGLGQDLPELLALFSGPRRLWRSLRTTNVIERSFVEVQRRTRPLVCLVNGRSVDRIVYSIFNRLNLEWSQRALQAFTQAA